MIKPNAVEMLRIKQDRTNKLRPEQRALLAQGFNSPFWGVLASQLIASLEECRDQLEACIEPTRISLLQGEIAALRVLLDWADATRKEGQQFKAL